MTISQNIPEPGGLPMAESQLEIDKRCDRIEAALGILADRAELPEIVRTILYGNSPIKERLDTVFGHSDGGGESRGEGDRRLMTPEEFHIAHDIAKHHHARFVMLADRYKYEPSIKSWEELPEIKKEVLIAVIADMLDTGIIRDKE